MRRRVAGRRPNPIHIAILSLRDYFFNFRCRGDFPRAVCRRLHRSVGRRVHRDTRVPAAADRGTYLGVGQRLFKLGAVGR